MAFAAPRAWTVNANREMMSNCIDAINNNRQWGRHAVLTPSQVQWPMPVIIEA